MVKVPRVAGATRTMLLITFVAAWVVTLGVVLPSDAQPLPCRDDGAHCNDIGFTDAWYDGGTVQLEFSHSYFCSQQPKNGFFFPFLPKCEAGDPAATSPPSGPVVSEVYLLIADGFTPPPDTLHCPTPGRCIDHPHFMDLSSVRGRAGQFAVLPPHSFVIEDEEAFQSTWWPVVLVFVETLDAWNAIAAAKSIEAVDECQTNGGCLPEVDTNAFLFFQVLGPGMSPQGPA